MKKFLELKHARDVLMDPKEKEKYDKKLSHELMAKRKQRERDAELDSKRRQMRDGTSWHTIACVCITTRAMGEQRSLTNGVWLYIHAELLRKEQSHDLKHKPSDGSSRSFRKSELSKLREKALARQQEMAERLARDARQREDLEAAKASVAASTSM